MSALDGKTAAAYGQLEEKLKAKRKEYEGFKKALGSDPALTSWIDGAGRMPQRVLSAFETATVKRMSKLLPEIREIEDELETSYVHVVTGLANKESDEGIDDPEVLLRAALVVMNKRFKTGDSSVELKLTMRAILDYLKSLAHDDDETA